GKFSIIERKTAFFEHNHVSFARGARRQKDGLRTKGNCRNQPALLQAFLPSPFALCVAMCMRNNSSNAAKELTFLGLDSLSATG
ncbi:hypothetical protein BaRGS_00030169, partial [Batillaria attramentaria]